MNMTAENKVLKNDLLSGDSNLIELREELKRLTMTKTRLDSEVMRLTAKGEDDEQTIETMEHKAKDLTSTVLRKGVEV